MSSVRAFSRRMKIATIVPTLIASCLATSAILTTTGATATQQEAKPVALPGHAHVPVQPVQMLATPTQIGQLAPAVPKNAADAVIAGATVSGIPAVALNAYQRAAQVINAADPSCNMAWELVGAIGRVESDNGQFGGNHLNAKGDAVPGIYGPVLDGRNGVGLIRDTDGGVLDHNTTYDRAVGPMQFLPSTWAVVGVDANGDAKRDPQNIYDASLAAAVYLCSGHTDLGTTSGQRAAVFRYNHSTDYVNLVLRIMQAYQAGDFSSIPAGAYGAPAASSAAVLPKQVRTNKAKARPTSSPSATTRPVATSSRSPRPTKPSNPTSPANPLQSLLNGLIGNKSASPSPASNTPMSSAAAASYCSRRLNGVLDLFNTLHTQCTKKVTGMTPAQADAGWAAHQSDLATWFGS